MEGPGDDVLCALREDCRRLEQRLAQRRRGKLDSDALKALSKDDAKTVTFTSALSSIGRATDLKYDGPVQTLLPKKRIRSGRQRRIHFVQDEVLYHDSHFEDVGIATLAGKQDRCQSHGACSRSSILPDSLHGQAQDSLRLSSDSHLARPHLTVAVEGPGDDVLLALKEDFKRPEQRLALRHCRKLQSPFNSSFHDIGTHGDVEHQGMVDEDVDSDVHHVCLTTSHESLPRASDSTDMAAPQGSSDQLATGEPACRNSPLQRAQEYYNAEEELLSLARAQGLTVLSPRSRALEVKCQST